MLVVGFFLEINLDLLVPSLEASLVKHAGEEQIDWGGAHLGHEHLLCLFLRHLSHTFVQDKG